MRKVLTNGCFDVLHAGHVDFLWKARTFGDWLIVALNSDASVSRLKGKSRPINPVELRQLVLRALRMVDDVVVFDEDNVSNVIRRVRPSVWVKGGDYTFGSLNALEVATATDVGARIEIIRTEYPISTSSILSKI